MPGSDRPSVLKVAQSVPGAWPTIPALMRLMSSQATFEPVSAKPQPVSGHTTCQIPDIENSCSRDSSRKTPPSVGSARFSSPKTRPLPANPRECRRFSHTWKSHRRDRTGWLPWKDSNRSASISNRSARITPVSPTRPLRDGGGLRRAAPRSFRRHDGRKITYCTRKATILRQGDLFDVCIAGILKVHFVAISFVPDDQSRSSVLAIISEILYFRNPFFRSNQ